MANAASSSEITSVPSECANDRLGKQSAVSVDQAKANSESSAESLMFKTRTESVNFRSDGPKSSSDSLAPTAFHASAHSNATTRFSPVESMLLRLIETDGVSEGYKQFCAGFPPDIPEVQGLSNKLRMIADQLDAAYIR